MNKPQKSCKHGIFSRSCVICELEDELAVARTLNGELRVEVMLRDKEITRLRIELEAMRSALSQAV